MGANEEYSVAVAGTEEEVFKVVISGVEEGSEKISFHYYLSVFGRQQRRHGDVSFHCRYDLKQVKNCSH